MFSCSRKFFLSIPLLLKFKGRDKNLNLNLACSFALTFIGKTRIIVCGNMRRILRYIVLVVVGTIALYPSVSMMLIWIDVWSAKIATINIPPDLATKLLMFFFTVAGCALTFGIISYFFLRLLQEDIKRLRRKRREKKTKPVAKETKTPTRKRKKTRKQEDKG